MKRLLLGIDLQNDFCAPNGKLYVQGAQEDLQNILRLLENAGNQFQEILISMDSHYPIHIAHPSYWRNQDGEMPALFSTITYQDLLQKNWIPQYYPQQSTQYLQALEDAAYQCTIWPPHCLIGTEGWAIPELLYRALSHWSHETGRNFSLYHKGSNPFTEHYSILKAAVEFPETPSTCFDHALLTRFSAFDEIILIGEAMDFCVASTLNDIAQAAPALMSKVVILTDCMSNIIPDNAAAKAIYDHAQNFGATMMTSIQYLQSLDNTRKTNAIDSKFVY